MDLFQSTHPSGVRRAMEFWTPLAGPISIHAPQWGATMYNITGYSSGDIFQSTHPSGVRPFHNDRKNDDTDISIHAPQWGATHIECGLDFGRTISIHAPQWGATGKRHLTTLGLVISIHAPQWGATQAITECHLIVYISIHAPQWGATVMRTGMPCDGVFQSTHPSGVRPRRRHCSTDWCNFNPRTPVGCDIRQFSQPTQEGSISIHAPQWGATPAEASALSARYFNPRTPVGCDRENGHSIP